MKPFSDLSQTARLRRLRKLAELALIEFGLGEARMVYHGFETNLFYRLTEDGRRYMLRLTVPGWRTLEGLRGEAMWLDALARDTGIRVPRMVRSSNGEAVIPVHYDGVPDPWNVCIMEYLPGKLLGHYLNPDNLRKMGLLFAEMHIHGAAWNPPPEFPGLTFQHYLSRGEPEALFMEENIRRYSPADHTLLLEMRDRVETVYASLDRSDIRVIHCDLWHDNIKLYRGNLIPFDFEDTVWGFRLHDIAMAMLDLLEDTGSERYPVLLEAFKNGYTSMLPWPEGSMELLQIGRLLWVMNWVARFQNGFLEESVQYHAAVFKRFNKTGEITFHRRSS